MSHHCPDCKRVLYNRRLKRCGFCNAVIPEELRFTPAEIAVLEEKMAELERQAQKRREKIAEEERAAQEGGSAAFLIIPPILPS